jgi:hypothetical protein
MLTNSVLIERSKRIRNGTESLKMKTNPLSPQITEAERNSDS